MKFARKLFVSLILFSLLAAAPASAKWNGAQLLTIGAVDNLTLTEDGRYAVRGSVHWFWHPQSETMLWFGYAGPRFNVSDWLWVSPQIGVAGGWNPEGGDAFLASVWAGLTPHPDVFILLESDVYVYGDTVDYYGYYFLDYNFKLPSGSIAIGPTFEHVNKDLILGPHVTFYSKIGPWISFQHWFAAKSEFEHISRAVAGFFF